MNTLDFWKGEFGTEYAQRNQGMELHASNLNLFSRILERTHGIRTVLELGANIGMNLRAINNLIPRVETSGVEINRSAWERLQDVCTDSAYWADITEMKLSDYDERDLVFTKGVLIHIEPEQLEKVYHLLYHLSMRYVMIAEYYNPVPVECEYRGESGKMWKRDFAGEMMERYPLRLVDYGFAYHGGRFPQDDITWFLMEKEVL